MDVMITLTAALRCLNWLLHPALVLVVSGLILEFYASLSCLGISDEQFDLVLASGFGLFGRSCHYVRHRVDPLCRIGHADSPELGDSAACSCSPV